MFVVILRDCIARPDADGRRFGLVEHLIAVAERCGRPDGPPEEKLAFLAGLLHDAAKASDGWQDYIRKKTKDGPPHAPLGAALFAVWTEDLIPRWTADPARRQRLFDLALDWVRIVYDHHGSIDDLLQQKSPWEESSAGFGVAALCRTCDREGLTRLVQCHYPETTLSLDDFDKRHAEFRKKWVSRMIDGRDEVLEGIPKDGLGKAPLAQAGLRLAELGARLIFADRSHVADWDVSYLERNEAERGCLRLGAHCGRRAEEAVLTGASPQVVRHRAELSAAALDGYRANRERNLFALLLPTGYGKTLAGLRVALEACRIGRCRRILYVAPYLSILSQAANEIRSASGLEVFVHHHMSAALLEDHESYDVLETWQAPVLATTFNQLCRSLFPARAQQCLRIPALDDSFLLIDEPQIIDPTVWNLFLKALAVVARRRRCQVLFLTATMPPTDKGLDPDEQPAILVPNGLSIIQDRYTICSTTKEWDPTETAHEACNRLEDHGSVAVVLNTVRDAVDVFYHLTKEKKRYCLTARMLPGHKERIIREVRRRLDANEHVAVAATQLIEAGVDLSFRSVLRARSIFSSTVQVAGRANRHGEEGDPAEVVVFPFRRADGKDSRPWIYRAESARRWTDGVLEMYPVLPESQVCAALEYYNQALWNENPNTASLGQFASAARGEWSALAGLKPFADDIPRIEVFVSKSDRYLTSRMRLLLESFGLRDSAEVLNRAQDPAFRRSLGFLGRKRFSVLVRQFCVSIPEGIVRNTAEETKLPWLWKLKADIGYSPETGLALTPDDDADEENVII